jgi:hypothetical protein
MKIPIAMIARPCGSSPAGGMKQTYTPFAITNRAIKKERTFSSASIPEYLSLRCTHDSG